MSTNTTERYISQIILPSIEEGETERLYFIKDKNAHNDIELLQSNLESLDTELDVLDTKVDNIEIPNISNLVSTDDLDNTVSGLITKQETSDTYVKWSALLTNYTDNTVLRRKYAHITNGLIDNAEISYEDIDGLYENYAHVDNNYIIDNATIDHENVNGLYENYAHVNNGVINNATISYTNINDLDDNYAHVTDGVIDNATISYININDLDENYARVINGIIIDANIDYTRINNLNDNYAHITGGLIDNASIRYTNIEDLDDNYAHVTDGIIDNANIDYAHINNLDANYAHITNGVIDNAYIDQAKINNLDANYAHITNGVIDNATINQADIEDLDANYAHITNGVIDNASIDYADINHLSAHYAHVDNGVIDNALIGYANVDQLETHYAEIDMANVNNAWIENGVIRDAAITDAKILGVSANKLTAGRIDAANINVINLRADNLIVTKINGQPVIGGYTLVSPEISGYIDKNPSQENWYEFYNNLYTLTVDTFVDPNKNYYTTSDSVELYDQTTIDSMFEDVNARIDSQIETWTVNELPTLLNYPAENWTTNDLKDAHIGDICYVVNASSDYNGYTYRFAYDNTSHQYSWVLIQDNQVTAALGRITQLETFNNQLVHWEDATDEGVITVRGRFTNLSGRIDRTVKSSIQLWYTKENTTAPNAPTSRVTSTSTNGGAWTTVVPIYDEDYPNYFYCWQYQYEDNTYGWSAVIYDQATTETQEAARTVPPDLLDYISDNIETIQEQVLDGQLEIWYGSTNPSLNNAPVDEWPSSKYEDHIGDLYYNITNGSVWQWTSSNSTYSWTEIPDSAASTALAAAQSAQATADGKRKIFTTTPTVPYDIGDLWVTGSTVKYANVAKTSSQTYNENDWSLTATDDTLASINIKSSVQLWYTSNSTTPPSKPYTDGSLNYITSTSTNGNGWTTVVPIYNSSTPKYHYCYQQQRGDNSYQWTTPVYDDATTIAMAKAQSALPISTFETFEQTTFKEVTDTIDTQQSTITQLQTKTDKALSQGVEYIVGTHGTTATNVWTGVTQDEQLYTGKQIAFYMTSAGVSSSAATLNLQLSDETWSGPINVKINDTNVTDQYPINTVLRLTYDGGSWKSDNYNSDTNYYDREAYKANVTASGAISAGRIGVFGTDEKIKLLSNSAFDTSYPILYIGTAYTNSALTQNNNYTFWGTPFNLTHTHSIVGAAAGKPVYIVGTLNGNIMTPTADVLTCTIPTEVDNLFYIRLGLMSTTTNAVLESQHPIYAFIDGAFQQTTKSVITVSNTVNTVRQTADTNSAKISNLTQTLGTNADGTTATDDIVHQISDIEQDLNGISTRVTKTEVSLRGTFATCSTAANTAAKEATVFPVNNDFELYTGATITVKFINNNTASAPTLKINSTDAKRIKTYSGADLSEAEYQWDAGSTMNFVYDGTNWRIQDSTELTRLKNNESRITQTADSITSLVANNENYTAPDGTSRTNTIRSAIQQNANNIALRVEKANVIASINASVETDGTSAVKISADKVNVEGAAIFNSGRLSTTNLDNAYDSKGSASAAQTAAISAAATDATNKANAAQSAAEATAAADATSKANAARDAAISAANQNTTQQINTVNNQEQLIYIQAVSGTLSIPDNQKPNAWVTNTGESVSSDIAGLTPVWTTKHPTYRSKYPVLFVATQRQTVGGTVTCTTPLKDDTITVIDGGHITTGTIDATNVNVTNINASEITTGTLSANRIESRSLTIDKFTDESQANILNSHIGQPNLTPYFSHSINDVYSSANTNGYWTQAHATIPAVTNDWSFEQSGPDGAGGCAHFDIANTGTSTAYLDSYIRKTALDLKPSTEYTFFVEWFDVTSSGGTPILYTTTQHGGTNGVNDDYFSTTTSVSITSGSGSSYISATTRATLESGCYNRIRTHLWVGTGITTSGYIRISLYEGKYNGPYKPYVDQTLSNRIKSAETSIEQNADAIALRATKTEVFDAVQPNLSPFLENTPYRTAATYDGGYWRPTSDNWFMNGVEHVSDGWAHVTRSGSQRLEIAIPPLESIDSSKAYTLMFEWRDVTVTGSPKLYARNYPHMCQFTKNAYACQWNESSPTSGVAYVKMEVDSTTKDGSWTAAIDLGMTNGSTVSFDGDIRLSIYEGEYAGPYKPYSGSQLYATQSELKVVNDNINLKVSKNDVINQINVSTEGVQIDASKVEINGTAIFSAISSDVDDAITDKGYQTASQVNSAITSKGYATTTQAQSYASTAKSEAISAAATDATTKANAAETNAKAYTDALEIGGRNLLYDTSGWSKWAKTTKATEADDVLTCVNTDTSSGFQRANGWFIPDKADVMDREIVVSFDAKKTDSTALSSLVFQMFTTSAAPKSVASGNINEGTRVYQSLGAASTDRFVIENASSINATTWTRVSLRFIPSVVFNQSYTEQAYLAVYIGISNTVASAQFRHIKAEYGNKATDWTPAPEDFASAVDSVEYIAGTQTAATGSWTGVTRDSSLYTGKTIAYKLPYAGSGSASLQLKNSSGNNVGGNIAVYSMTTRVTTHYPAGSVIQMTYDGTYWRTAGWYNSNNYDRNLHNNYVKAAANVVSGQLVCGTSAGYKPIAASATFDMSYPILWAGGAWTSGTQYANAYETYPSVNPATTAAVQGIAVNKMVYVKGQISGNTFTCAASNFLTCTVPNSEDGYFYLPVGMVANDATTKMYFNTSKDLYAYLDGRFRQVTPTEIMASQRIYYRSKVSGTVPKPTAWVTLATNQYNDTVSVGNGGWSTKVTPIAASIAENVTKYLYLYTCEQRKRLDGTVECTAVTLDENTTIIDGGNIITHTVTADQLNAASINASNSLTVGAFNTSTQNDILNSNIEFGGRNFLLESGLERSVTLTSATSSNFYTEYVNESDYGKSITNGNTTDTFVMSFDWSTTSTDGVAWLQIDGNIISNIIDGNGGFTSGSNTRNKGYIDISLGSGRYWAVFRYTATQAGKAQQRVRIRVSGAEVSGKTLTENSVFTAWNFKLERGSKATDWTSAPEDVSADISQNYNFLDGRIDDLNSQTTEIQNSLETSSKSLDERLTDLEKDYIDDKAQRDQWLNFNTSDGLIIGNNTDTFKTVISSESMQFINGDAKLAEASGAEFAANIMSSEELHIGKWMWTKRNNGNNLSLKWIG